MPAIFTFTSMQKPLYDFVQRVRKAERRLVLAKHRKVRVGWVDGTKTHENALTAPGKPQSGPSQTQSANNPTQVAPRQMTLASIAKLLCYGRAAGKTATGRKYPAIPPRNFVQVLRDKHIRPLQREITRQVFDLSGADLDLPRIGVIAKGQLQRAIKDSPEYAPLSPRTVARRRKHSSKPLIDTGILVNSVDFDIQKA